MLSTLVQKMEPLRKQLQARQSPRKAQAQLLRILLRRAANTAWGKRYGFAELANTDDVVTAYQSTVPLHDYSAFCDEIERMRRGEKDRLWAGEIQAFAVSSGTASMGKIIPVSMDTLRANQRFTLTVGLNYGVQAKTWAFLFGKQVSLPGRIEHDPNYPGTTIGEISGHVAAFAPAWLRRGLQAVAPGTSSIANWDQKLQHIAAEAVRKDIRVVVMAPTWGQVFFDHVVEQYQHQTGQHAETIGEIWPRLQLFISGGVALQSYKSSLADHIGLQGLYFVETYGASEGFFAFQSDLVDPALEVHLDSGVFYEFVPIEDVGKPVPRRYGVADVQVGVSYALYVTTCSGLWAYSVGDIVRFTQTFPHKLVVAGRTTEMLDRYGEAVSGEEVRTVLHVACKAHQASVREFHVANCAANDAPQHQWLIEFDQEPIDLEAFRRQVDQQLCRINRHYQIRRDARALAEPTIIALPKGSFYAWLKKTRRTIGGQTKVPRLSEERTVADGVLRVAGNKGENFCIRDRKFRKNRN